MRPKPPIPWYWWAFWMFLLVCGLFIFYVLLTPVWVGIRLIEWFAHRREAAEGLVQNSNQNDASSARRP